MNTINWELRREERAIFLLRELYESFGYKRYKISKFEEYELYIENKSFLPSQHLITFTDLSGKLMALKPDVTLSIAKNAPSDISEPIKVYYNENVYRAPRGSREYKEIMQLGLEYIGGLDLFSQCEVLGLASESLARLSEEYVMVLSDLGFLSGILEYCALPFSVETKALSYISHRNAHELERLCQAHGVAAEKREALVALTSLYGGVDETLERAQTLVKNEKMRSALVQLKEIAKLLEQDKQGRCLRVDFSLVSDLAYYNGLIFQGYIEGVPGIVLSGGRYDRLMEKLGKKASALGFAVYLDQLEHEDGRDIRKDADIVFLYDNGADFALINATARELRQQGLRVRVQREMPEKLRYGKLLRLEDGRLEEIEAND